MALKVDIDYFEKKSVKLSDSFEVLYKTKSTDGYKLLESCLSFTLPNFSFKEEVHTYNNRKSVVLIPDYDSVSDIKFSILENSKGYNIKNIKEWINSTFNVNSINYKNVFNYALNEICIKIFSNDFSKLVEEYFFYNLKITDYNLYELNYESGDALDCKLDFSMSFEKSTYNKNK